MEDRFKQWNDWRQAYGDLSFQDHVKLHEKWAKDYPNQASFTPTLINQIRSLTTEKDCKVMELGGWDGQLAAKCLENNLHIKNWQNIDIVTVPSKCTDSRFQTTILPIWFWMSSVDISNVNLFIASHVFEHMKFVEIRFILKKIQSIPKVCLEVPIVESGENDWTNYEGAHILEYGRQELISLFAEFDYVLDYKQENVLTFQKKVVPKVQYFDRPQKILVVGWCMPSRAGGELARAFREQGHTVILIATERNAEGLTPYNLHLMTDVLKRHGKKFYEDAWAHFERVPLKPYIDEYGPFDFLFLHQSNVYFDVTGVDIPYFYYHHEFLYPDIPRGKAPDGLFFAYHGAYEQLYWNHTPEINQCFFHEFVPYATTPSLFHPEKNFSRFVNLGFKGATHMDNGKMNTPVMNSIYDNRVRFLTYLQKHHHLHVENRSEGADMFHHWINFMQHVNIGVNIPGLWGWVNERQFHLLGLGCLLLQWRYPGIGDLGFRDRYNCFLFSTEKELTHQLRWIKWQTFLDHFRTKKQIETIRARGIALAHEHTYTQRANQILEKIGDMLVTKKEQITKIRENQRRVKFFKNHDHDLVDPKNPVVQAFGKFVLSCTKYKQHFLNFRDIVWDCKDPIVVNATEAEKSMCCAAFFEFVARHNNVLKQTGDWELMVLQPILEF